MNLVLLAHGVVQFQMKVLFLLKAYICSGSINPGLGLKLFDQMVRPILCYGSELWCTFGGNKKIFQNTDDIAKFLDSLDIEKVHIISFVNFFWVLIKGQLI